MHPMYLYKMYINHIINEFKKGSHGQKDQKTGKEHEKTGQRREVSS